MMPDLWCTTQRHGTITAYSTDGCRCTSARAAMTAYEKGWRATGPRRIDATGTRRRLQALMAAGWSSRELGPRLFVHTSQVTKWVRIPSISTKSAARVADLYDQIGLDEGPSAYTRGRALRAGWPPPIEWGDDIDDPAAKPLDIDRIITGPRAAADMGDVEMLIAAGATWASICARLDTSQKALARRLERCGRRDLLARLTAASITTFEHRNQWSA
jgi:hypothetical protein